MLPHFHILLLTNFLHVAKTASQAYANVVTYVVKTTCLTAAIHLGTLVSGLSICNNCTDNAKQRAQKAIGICAVSLMSVILSMMFQGLLDTHSVLHNPFGNRENDVPHELLSSGLRNLAYSLRDTANTATLNFDGTWVENSAARTIQRERTQSRESSTSTYAT